MNTPAPAVCATLIGAVGLTTAALLSVGHDSAVAQTPPTNDAFGRATFIPASSRPFDQVLPFDATQSTFGATLEASEPKPCAPVGATVWYQIDFPIPDLDISIDTAGSDFQTAVAVYTLTRWVPSPPDGASLQAVACDATTAADRARVTVRLPREPIYIQIGGLNGATGTLHLHIDCVSGCANSSPTTVPTPAPLPTFVPTQAPVDAALPKSTNVIVPPTTGTDTQPAGEPDHRAALVALLFLFLGSASLLGGALRVR